MDISRTAFCVVLIGADSAGGVTELEQTARLRVVVGVESFVGDDH